VVVGRVIEVTTHPNADRLRVCQVDVGGGTAQIVCGAANVRAGGLYPVALPGATLPGGLVIRSAALRGVDSAGMLCSAAELGLLGDKADAGAGAPGKGEGLLELDQGLIPGMPVAAALALDDQVLDLKITPNRADCFCVLGVARDLAATTGLAFAEPRIKAIPAADSQTVSVRIEDTAGCPVFVVRAVRGIRADARSPLWLRERLRRSGVRSVHPVVDITSLVMLELGQPLHAYDLDKLDGGLVVRRALAREPLQLLTGADLQLDDDVLVIADGTGAVGIAGIMGGARTAVSATTTNVLLESAFFSPATIAGRARRLGLQTDAATRFERGVDPTGQQRALERAAELLLDICGGTPGACHTTGSGVPPRSPVTLRRARLAQVLGDAVPDQAVETILRRLSMAVDVLAGGWQVRPPAFRFDIAVEVDLIEEVARVYGYDRIATRPGAQTTQLGEAPATRVSMDLLRGAFVQRGYQEVMTYSFVEREQDRIFAGGRDGVPLVNPLSAELAVMRQGLWPGLVQALRHNLARQQRRVRIFEVGVRFHPDAAGLAEEVVLSGLALGSAVPEQWGESARPVDFFDVKSDLEAMLAMLGAPQEFDWVADVHPALHPGIAARLSRRGEHVGWLGALHPGLTKQSGLDEAPIMFELAASGLSNVTLAAYQGLSRFPAVRRDIAVLVARATPVAGLVAAVRDAAGPALREVVVFDIFAGEHIDAAQKSVALGLILQETSRTLTDDDGDQIVAAVVQRLAADFGAKIRE
jgi:phenylalanyl-tRNA synthetase beta chain